MASERLDRGRLPLVALFVTALLAAQVTATKIASYPIPFALPGVGEHLIFPAAAPAYALTFFASDCYAELYGREDAQWLVNVAFAMNFVLLALLWLATGLKPLVPPAEAQFDAVMLASTNVVLGSLAAYVVSQNWDVVAFHRIRNYTDGASLWLRNVGSTASSQAIDTVIFILVAFVAAPRLLGVGDAYAADVVLGLIVGQYLLKLGIALLDTPFVYAVVGYLRGGQSPAAPA